MDALQYKWSQVISSQPTLKMPPLAEAGPGASASSPGKGAKSSKRGGATAAPSAQGGASGPDDIPARFGGCSFLYRDVTYVIGTNSRGAFECYSIVPAESTGITSPTSGAGRAVSPKKSGKKGTNAAATAATSSPTKHSSGSTNTKMTARQVFISGTKSPTPRALAALCVATGATSPPPAGKGGLSPPAHNTSIDGQQLCDAFFNAPVTGVYVHGGLQATTSEGDGSDAPAATGGGSAIATMGMDDLWEFRCSNMSWQQVSVRPPLLSKRFGHAMAYTNGRLYVFGGIDARGLNALGDFWMLEDSGGSKRWSAVIAHGACSAGSASGLDDGGVMRLQRPCARSHHSLVASPDGCLLLHGGISAHGAVLNDLWCVQVGHEGSLGGAYDAATLGTNVMTASLVVWRRVEAAGDSIPRRLGSTLLVAPMPRLAPTNRRPSTAAPFVTFHQPEAQTPQFMIIICGGWDAETTTPYVLQPRARAIASTQKVGQPQQLDEPSPMMQRLASMAFSSVDGGSFRFASFRQGSVIDGARLLEKSLSPFRRRQSVAGNDAEDAASSQQQQQQQPNDPATASSQPLMSSKRLPVLVAFSANMDTWRVDHASGSDALSCSPRSSAAAQAIDGADLESLASHGAASGAQGGARSPAPKAPAGGHTMLSKLKVLGKRPSVANSAGRLGLTTFAGACRQAHEYTKSLAVLRKQLLPACLEVQRLELVLATPAHVPTALMSPVAVSAPSGLPLLDASALGASRRDDDALTSHQATSESAPLSTMFGYWCRSSGKHPSGSAVELTVFGGNCGPMVACGDVWRCRVEWIPQPQLEFGRAIPFHTL